MLADAAGAVVRRDVAHVLTFPAHHRLLARSRLRECGVPDLGFGDPKHWFAAGRSQDAALDPGERDWGRAGMMLPLWEDALPNTTDEERRAAAEEVAAPLED